ncbi:MAG: hypothetical protein ACYS32_09960 [Planctomycetota bacterium]
MEKLKEQLDDLVSSLENESELRQRLGDLFSVFPFNEYEYIISTLLGLGKLSLDEYYELRDEYISRNMFLYVFEISAPRGFGENWAQGHLKELVPELVKPSKKRDPDYSGQYDFYLDEKMRIEVKASRAVDFNSSEALPVKALPSSSEKEFDMNFQQTKPACCDVFIWVGVWRDVIRYWILASDEVANNKYFSKGQHRGNVGEGQLHLKHDNIDEFAKYEAKSNRLLEAIRNAYKRQTKK